jgi:molybdate transport system ATP-binding protein
VIRAELEWSKGAFRLEAQVEVGATPLAIVGPNGAGKTSLLLGLLGALRPLRGQIWDGDACLFDSARGVDVPVEARRLAYVPQTQALFPHLKVADNVAFGLSGLPAAAERKARAVEALRRLGAAHLLDRDVRSLSGGERQKVALARALAVEPRALLLDEPLAALDVLAHRQVRAELAGILSSLGRPALVVTHDPQDAVALAGQIAVMELGRIVQVGTPAELSAQPANPFVAALFPKPGRGPDER